MLSFLAESNTTTKNSFLFCACILFIAIIIYLLYRFLCNPFKYPYFKHSFDVTGKRMPDIEDYIDKFLLDQNNWSELISHETKLQQWKIKCGAYLESCVFKKYRAAQYARILDDNHAYQFILTRKQTRYRQHNYVRTPYKVQNVIGYYCVSWLWLEDRYKQLDEIAFQATLKDYHTKNQRKLMSKDLRMRIMKRDKYTCQMCGKFMPDEVGLHIDHIVPVSKGGKSVESNLRVLCSKCNGRKGAK